MAELKDKVKVTLDEARMLILGGQVLVGFGCDAVFYRRFEALPAAARAVHVVSLALLMAGLAVAMAPAARHQIVERGNISPALHRFATAFVGASLLPFAIGLGASLYVALRVVVGPGPALAGGAAGLGLALFLWYGLKLVAAGGGRGGSGRHDDGDGGGGMEQTEKVELFDKIDHALTEARMILPGAQAMLGFQFVAILTDPFNDLPASSKAVHVVSLVLVAAAITCLMTPAAFHRIVERGEATPRQYKVTVGFVLAGMAALAPGITGDLYVVLRKVSRSGPLAAGVAGGVLALYYGLWFGLSLVVRATRQTRREYLGRLSQAGQREEGAV